MTSRNRSPAGQLLLTQNWLAEETWKASDEEILEDAKAAGLIPEAESERFKAILKKAETQAGKARFLAAKAAAAEDHARRLPAQSVLTNPQAARALLNRVATNNPQFREKLMIAARNAKTSLEQLPDSDVQTWIEMAQELGLLPAGDKSE